MAIVNRGRNRTRGIAIADCAQGFKTTFVLQQSLVQDIIRSPRGHQDQGVETKLLPMLVAVDIGNRRLARFNLQQFMRNHYLYPK